MADIIDINKNTGTAEQIVKNATTLFREYMDIPFIPEEEEFLFKAFGGKPGQGKVKTPKKLTAEQAIAFLDYSGFPLADENAKFSIASSIKLNAPELFDDASFEGYEKKFGKLMEMQEKGASASKNIVAGKPIAAANEPVAAKGKSVTGKTIQEAFQDYLEGDDRSPASINTMKRSLKELEAAGFPSDSLLSELNSEEGIKRLHKYATKERFDGPSSAAGNLASRIKTLITSGTGVDEVNVLSNYESKHRGTTKEFGIRFTRLDRKLEYPDFDSFNKAIDATARKIPDKEARAFFLIKMLTGLRNPDIVNLELGRAVQGAKYGSFDPAIQKIYALSNKGDRINYDLGEVVHGILADLAADAEASGRTTLFSKTGKSGEDFYRNKINPVMRKTMAAMDLQIFDLRKGQAVPFSIRDLRKNIFDILEEEEGPGAANKVLGHSSGSDVGLKHYKVERTRRKSLSGLQRSQELFSSLYLESIGFDNPQLVFGQEGYGFSSDRFNPSTVTQLTAGVPEEQQRAETRTRNVEAQVESTVDTTSDSLSKRINRLEDLISKAAKLKERAGELLPSKRKESAAVPSEEPVYESNPDLKNRLVSEGFDAERLANTFFDVVKKGLDKIPPKVKKAVPFIAAPGGYQLGKEYGEQAGLPGALPEIIGAATAATEVLSPIAPSDVQDASVGYGGVMEKIGEDRQSIISRAKLARSKKMEEEGFINRGTEATSGNTNQGFAIPRVDITLDDLPPERQADYR